MNERNITVALTIACKVEGGLPVQDVGQNVAADVADHLESFATRLPSSITPLRVELERAHERSG